MEDPIKASLSILPHEKLIEILLALDSLEDIFKACRSSTIFARVCQDDHFWKLRYQQDFGSGRPSEKITWKEFYKLMVENHHSPLSAGSEHWGVIDQDCQLHMSGDNGNGQLGNGTRVSTKISQMVLTNVCQVSCACNTTGAVTKNGEVYSWGSNYDGILGIGSSQNGNILVPTLVPLSKKVRKINYDCWASIALTEDGEIYVWGQLSHFLRTKIPIKLNLPPKEKAIDVAAGFRVFAAVTRSGKLYMWGVNKNYPLLSKNWKNEASGIYNIDDPEHRKFLQPTLIPFPKQIRQISMGPYHFGIVTKNGELWMTGANYFHQIGEYTLDKKEANTHHKYSKLIPIKLPGQVLYLNTHWGTSLVKLKDGRIFMWGNNNEKQIGPVKCHERSIGLLGVSGGREISKPTEIKLDHPIVYIAAGGSFTIAITDDDYINLWGEDYPPLVNH